MRTSEGQHEANCLYISEQVLVLRPRRACEQTASGTYILDSRAMQANVRNGQEWLPLSFSEANIPSEQLHGLLSGVLHIHIYAVHTNEPVSIQRTPGPFHPSLQTLKVINTISQLCRNALILHPDCKLRMGCTQ